MRMRDSLVEREDRRAWNPLLVHGGYRIFACGESRQPFLNYRLKLEAVLLSIPCALEARIVDELGFSHRPRHLRPLMRRYQNHNVLVVAIAEVARRSGAVGLRSGAFGPHTVSRQRNLWHI